MDDASRGPFEPFERAIGCSIAPPSGASMIAVEELERLLAGHRLVEGLERHHIRMLAGEGAGLNGSPNVWYQECLAPQQRKVYARVVAE